MPGAWPVSGTCRLHKHQQWPQQLPHLGHILGISIISASLDQIFSQVLAAVDSLSSCDVDEGGWRVQLAQTRKQGASGCQGRPLSPSLPWGHSSTGALLISGVGFPSFICPCRSLCCQGGLSPVLWTPGLGYPVWAGPSHSPRHAPSV